MILSARINSLVSFVIMCAGTNLIDATYATEAWARSGAFKNAILGQVLLDPSTMLRSSVGMMRCTAVTMHPPVEVDWSGLDLSEAQLQGCTLDGAVHTHQFWHECSRLSPALRYLYERLWAELISLGSVWMELRAIRLSTGCIHS